MLLSLAVNVSHRTLAVILVAVLFYALVILTDRFLICCKYYEVRLFDLNVAGVASYTILGVSLLDPFFTIDHSLSIVSNLSNLSNVSNVSSTVITWSGLQIAYIVFVVAVFVIGAYILFFVSVVVAAWSLNKSVQKLPSCKGNFSTSVQQTHLNFIMSIIVHRISWIFLLWAISDTQQIYRTRACLLALGVVISGFELVNNLCLNYYELKHFFVKLAIIRSLYAPDTLMKHYTQSKYSSFRERFVHGTLSPVGLLWGFVYGSLLLALLIASSVSSTGTPSLYACVAVVIVTQLYPLFCVLFGPVGLVIYLTRRIMKKKVEYKCCP